MHRTVIDVKQTQNHLIGRTVNIIDGRWYPRRGHRFHSSHKTHVITGTKTRKYYGRQRNGTTFAAIARRFRNAKLSPVRARMRYYPSGRSRTDGALRRRAKNTRTRAGFHNATVSRSGRRGHRRGN